MGRDDTDWKEAAKAVPELRFLKALVTGLSLVMGLGMVAVVLLLWMRLGQPALPDLPETLSLPEGAEARAVTFAPDRIIVLTDGDVVLVYDLGGRLLGQVALRD